MTFAARITNVTSLISLLRKKDLSIIIFLFLFAPLFFYNLGGYSLIDFDEAWWAEIARNILIRKDPLLLFFNGSPVYFHPPFGYLLIAISQYIFGVNEFASRLPSATLGFGSILITFAIGKKLFNSFVGLTGSLMLVSSVWFIFRSRSGNLDAILVFMFLLTFYLFTKAKEKGIFLYICAISLAFLFMTKALIGASVLAPIGTYHLINLRNTQVSVRRIIFAFFITIYILSPWFFSNYLTYGWTFLYSLFQNGLKPGQQSVPNLLKIHQSLTMLYLHFGILKWYYPGVIATIGSIFFVKKFPNVIVLYAWLLPLLAIFLISLKTEIWHLIPLYPSIGLIIGFFIYASIDCFFSIIKGKFNIKIIKNLLVLTKFFAIGLVLLLCFKLIYGFRNQINLFDKHQSPLATVSYAARNLSGQLYLDNDHFLPSVVFYSQKHLLLIRGQEKGKNTLKELITNQKKPFLVVTERWRIEADKIDQTRLDLLAEKEDYLLLRVKKLK